MCGSVGFGSFGGMQGLQFAQALTGSMAAMQQERAAAAQHAQSIAVAKQRMDDEYKMRVANAVATMQEANLAQQQANEAATQSKSEIAREMFRAREEAKAAASAAGVAGNSLNRLLTDISFTEQQKKAVADTNRDNIVNTQQLQKHKAVQSTKMSPFYYSEYQGGGGSSFFNSMLGVVPSLFSGFTFNSSCGTTTKSSCR